MNRGIGQRQAARDYKICGGKTEHREHDEFAAPTGRRIFEQAGGATAVRRAADDVPIDWESQEERDEHDTAGGDRRPGAGGLRGDRGQVGEGAEVVDANQAQH